MAAIWTTLILYSPSQSSSFFLSILEFWYKLWKLIAWILTRKSSMFTAQDYNGDRVPHIDHRDVRELQNNKFMRHFTPSFPIHRRDIMLHSQPLLPRLLYFSHHCTWKREDWYKRSERPGSLMLFHGFSYLWSNVDDDIFFPVSFFLSFFPDDTNRP